MHKITIKTDGLTGSGVAGEMSNFGSEFGDAEDYNEDDDEYNGISSEDSGLKREEVN